MLLIFRDDDPEALEAHTIQVAIAACIHQSKNGSLITIWPWRSFEPKRLDATSARSQACNDSPKVVLNVARIVDWPKRIGE